MKTTLSTFLISVFLLSFFALSEDQVVQEVELSAEEIQESLGITAWKIQVPESFGDRFRLRYEQFVGEERVYLQENGYIVDEPNKRELLITIRTEGDHLIAYSRGVGATSLGTYHLRIQKDDGAFEGNWVITDSVTEVLPDQIVLKRWLHQTKKDLTEVESDTNPVITLATKVLSLVSDPEVKTLPERQQDKPEEQ